MVAYADELCKVQLTWTPNSADWPSEVAVNTFWLQHHHISGNSFNWSTALQDIADGVEGRLESHWSAVSNLFASGYQITRVVAAQIDPTGHATAEATNSPASGTLPGTGTAGVLPPEVSICLSLFGYPPGGFVPQRGRKRGRMFLPYISASTCDAHGKISSGATDTVMSGFGAIFNDIQGMEVGSGGAGPTNDWMNLVIASGFGIATQVDHLAVDQLFDAQRRRQNREPSTWKTVTIEHS